MSQPDSTQPDNTQPDNTQEEPQEARGAPGSRDEGGDGPVERTSGTSDADDHTGVAAEDPVEPDMPTLQSGGG